MRAATIRELFANFLKGDSNPMAEKQWNDLLHMVYSDYVNLPKDLDEFLRLQREEFEIFESESAEYFDWRLNQAREYIAEHGKLPELD
jgi:hypothetical protein